MDTDQILDSVELVAGMDRDDARLAVDATLLTLAERVGRAVAGELAGGLPRELEPALTAGPDAAEPFDAEEFARRTAARASFATGCRPTTGRCSASILDLQRAESKQMDEAIIDSAFHLPGGMGRRGGALRREPPAHR